MRPGFSIESNLNNYIVGIAKNLFLREVTKEKKQRQLRESPLTENSVDPDIVILRKEKLSPLRKLLNQLDETCRKVSFENELAKNEELRKAVDNHDVVEDMMDLMWEDEIRRVMKDGGEEAEVDHFERKGSTLFSLKSLLAIAASLIALIAAFTLMQKVNKSMSGPELFASHYSPFIETNITRGEEGTPINLSDCDLGHYHMEAGEYEKAKDLFMGNLVNGPNGCSEKSEWYLCLHYLRIENIVERDKLLDKILNNPKHRYHQKALKLQADLE